MTARFRKGQEVIRTIVGPDSPTNTLGSKVVVARVRKGVVYIFDHGELSALEYNVITGEEIGPAVPGWSTNIKEA